MHEFSSNVNTVNEAVVKVRIIGDRLPLSDNIFPAGHVFRHSRSSLTFSFIEENDKLVLSAYILTSECFAFS